MVLVLKEIQGETLVGQNRYDANLVRLAKYMINIEYNKKYYRENGKFDYKGDTEEFNVFRDEQFGVTYSVKPSNGWIYLSALPKRYSSVDSFIEALTSIFDSLEKECTSLVKSEQLIPTSFGSFHPTTHGTILYKQTTEHWVRYILKSPTAGIIGKIRDGFIWGVFMLDDVFNQVVAKEGISMEEHIAFRHLSSVVMDYADIFTKPDTAFQLQTLKYEEIANIDHAVDTVVCITMKNGLGRQLQVIMSETSNLANIGLSNNRMTITDRRDYTCTSDDITAKIASIDFDELPNLVPILMWDNTTIQPVIHRLTSLLHSEAKADEKKDGDGDGDDGAASDDSANIVIGTKKKRKTKKKDTDINIELPVNNVHTDMKPEVRIARMFIEKAGSKYDATRNDVCVLCNVPLYEEIYVLQSLITKKCVGVCDICGNSTIVHQDTMENPLSSVLWRTTYPRTMLRVLDDVNLKTCVQKIVTIDDADKYIEILKLIVMADKRTIFQRYVEEDGSTLTMDERWQFRFSGTKKGKKYDVYMINDSAFTISDYKLLARDRNVYIVRGGIVNL